MRGTFRSLAAFCLGTSALIAAPAAAQVIDYPNGTNSGSTINLTASNTQLQVLTGSAVQSGSILGGGNAVEKIGAGSLTISGFTNYSGGTTVSAGTLIITNNNGFGFGAITLNGGTLQVSSPVGVAGSFTVAPTGGTIDVQSGGTLSFSSGLFGTGDLIKTGPGALSLGGGTFSGAITVLDGALNGGISTGALTLSSSATLNVTFANNSNFGSLAGSGTAFVDQLNSLTVGSDNTTTTFSGTLTGTGKLTKTGTGALILTGSNSLPTTINGGTLQVGNGGTTGAITGNVMDNGALVFSRSDSFSYGGTISGTGQLVVNSGTLILTNTSVQFNIINSYTGGTVIAPGATLQLGNGGGTSGLAGGRANNVINNGHLIANQGNQQAIVVTLAATTISGIGDVTITGGGFQTLSATNSFSGGLKVAGGSSVSFSADAALGAGRSVVLGDQNAAGFLQASSSLSLAHDVVLQSGGGGIHAVADVVVSGSISGPGSLLLTSSNTGSITLLGNNSYTGETTINFGSVQVGNGGMGGSIVGNVSNSGTLAFNRSDDLSFSGSISGSGALTKLGSGMLTLSAISPYTGVTKVGNGTLNVSGAIAGSNVSVANGATLTGTGKIGPTTIVSGGTLNPGSTTTPGTLSVVGNLTLVAGSNYLDAVAPTVAGLTSVSGAASINGNVIANFVAGTYTPGQRYAILTASGGISGTFASLTGLPAGLKGQLTYDANNVYLFLTPNALSPLLSGATANQHGTAAAIDASVAVGNVPPAGFTALYTLSGSALNSALDQISGQAAPNVTNAVGGSFLSFMSMTAQGGSGTTGSFAPGSAYGSADAPHRAQLGTGETRVWGAAYGGHVGLSGDSASGAAGLSSNNVGMIGGADMRVADGILAGVTLGLGRQSFRSGNGTGDSDDVMLGLYGRADAGAAYVAASFGIGWHQIKTQRVITVSGTDVLQGKQNANDFGGRVEAGWHMPLDDAYTVTPYGAFGGASFESPAYAETAVSGTSTFALSYAAQTTTLGRSELGTHLDRNYALEHGVLTADLRAAWAHQLDDQPFTQATFLTLPGSAFQVAGVRPDQDTALLGLDLEMQNASGLFFGVRGEGQFGAGTTAIEGMGNFGWRW